MDELTLDGQTYLSSKRAAQVTGYAKDYVGQLCREGRVDARLVGRNWYVLESSILEHRFGKPEAGTEGSAAQETPRELPTTWETPNYAPEPVHTLTESMTKPAPVIAEAPESAPDTEKVLADMQSAWKEWFDRQEKVLPEPPEVEEELLAAGNGVEEDGEASEASNEVEEERIHETKAPEAASEEVIPIHIQRVAFPEPPVRAEEPRQERVTPHPVREPRMASQRRIRRVRGRSRAGEGNMAVRAAFIAIAGIAVAATVIGSGWADTILHVEKGGSPVTNYLGGVQQISK